MSNLFAELNKEAEKQQKQLEQHKQKSKQTPAPEKDLPGAKTVPNSQSVTPEVTNSASSKPRKSATPAVRKLQTYELTNYDKLFRLDVRLTYDQIAFLDKLEAEIRLNRPDLERNRADHKRITKNSVVRVLIEIMRQIDLQLDASQFYNELDLFDAIYQELKRALSQTEGAK